MRSKFCILILALMVISFASSDCALEVSLLNQDPYPALPGDYVKLVFQIDGVNNLDCSEVNFWIEESFPFSLDPNAENKTTIKSGGYVQNYKNFFVVPYKVRLDKDAMDGENEILTYYSSKENSKPLIYLKRFNITVENPKTDFEVNIKDYSEETKILTFEILNIGQKNVDALTIEIPEQENIKIIKSQRLIVGSLDSNEDDVAAFEATPSKGDLTIKILYTDYLGERRQMEKKVYFNPDYFPKENKSSSISPTMAFILGLLIPIIVIFAKNQIKKNKEKKRRTF